MLPAVHETIVGVREAVAASRHAGKSIGLVPTMGALHAGHARLIEVARQECDLVVVSIFVNPTQFGPNEDFERYPRSFDSDRELCGDSGADMIFHPSSEAMYPAGFRTFVEVSGWQDVLCGKTRPDHFRGVCTVVLKLFEIIRPDAAFFGQKDAQQVLILKRMVDDLAVPIRMRTVPTVREPDGLAMSSRNRYLAAEDRRKATALSRSLIEAERMILVGERNADRVASAMRSILDSVPGLRIDYVQIVSRETLTGVTTIGGPILIAVAAYLGSTRLIDNVMLEVDAAGA